jgi:hypothetical protein
MNIPDFTRSFLTFRLDFEKKPPVTVSHAPPFSLNNARMQLESRCRIRDRESGIMTEYVLGASCKTERVGVLQDVWLEPNADMCMVLSEEHYLDVKSWDTTNKGGTMLYPPSRGVQPERLMGKVADVFDSTKISLRMVEGELLRTAQEIVKATLADELLVGQVEFSAQERYDVILDFPIKTMNANERHNIYQTDTGPIILPDFSIRFDHIMETFQWAYVAFNCPDWAEFILRAPTPLTDKISVNHYSKTLRLDTKNTVFRIKE